MIHTAYVGLNHNIKFFIMFPKEQFLKLRTAKTHEGCKREILRFGFTHHDTMHCKVKAAGICVVYTLHLYQLCTIGCMLLFLFDNIRTRRQFTDRNFFRWVGQFCLNPNITLHI